MKKNVALVMLIGLMGSSWVYGTNFSCPKAFEPTAGWEMDNNNCGDVLPNTAVFIRATSEDNKIENQYALCCYRQTSLLKRAPPNFNIIGAGWKRLYAHNPKTDKDIARIICGKEATGVAIEKCQFKLIDDSTSNKKSAQMILGEAVYLKHCSNCHKVDGSGMPPVTPALKGEDVAAISIDRTVQIVTKGIPGTIMLSFRGKQADDPLTDEELAAVITYVHNAWGNDDEKKYGPLAGGSITAAELKVKVK